MVDLTRIILTRLLNDTIAGCKVRFFALGAKNLKKNDRKKKAKKGTGATEKKQENVTSFN